MMKKRKISFKQWLGKNRNTFGDSPLGNTIRWAASDKNFPKSNDLSEILKPMTRFFGGCDMVRIRMIIEAYMWYLERPRMSEKTRSTKMYRTPSYVDNEKRDLQFDVSMLYAKYGKYVPYNEDDAAVASMRLRRARLEAQKEKLEDIIEYND